MQEAVQNYINQKKAEIHAHSENEKRDLLISLGLSTAVYSPYNQPSEEYPYGEWNENTQSYAYYNIIPLEVTDEEYEEILKVSKTKDNAVSTNNKIASALQIIAYVIFGLGALAGFIIFCVEPEEMFLAALSIWSIAGIQGVMFLGFAEILKLLHSINKKL